MSEDINPSAQQAIMFHEDVTNVLPFPIDIPPACRQKLSLVNLNALHLFIHSHWSVIRQTY